MITRLPSTLVGVVANISSVSVPAEVLERVRAGGLNQRDGARTLRRAAGHAALYFATIAVAETIDHPLVWAAAWVLLGVILVGSVAASHEAIHNNLFASKGANRIAGTVSAALGGVPWSAYRAYHLAHHADTRGPSDPEPQENVTGPFMWVVAMLFGGLMYAVQQWWAVAATVVGRPPAWAAHRIHRRAMRRAGLGAVVVLGGVVLLLSRYPGPVVRWWLVPTALVWVGLGSFVVIPEHHGLRGDNAFASTRTTRSNALFRWLFWNNNLHTAHHLLPTVPWHQLDALQEIIEPRCEHIERGYFDYHRKLLLGQDALVPAELTVT